MLTTLINRNALEALAGGTAFQRGEEYFAVGAVGRLRAQEDKVFAKVEGTETYQVELWNEDGELAGDCTCPRAGDGYFCKHCVAVGLAWLSEHDSAPAQSTGRKPTKAKRHDPWKDIRQFLEAQPAESLVEVLLDVAQRDDRLFQSLLLKAERTHGGGNAEKAFQRAIDDAVRIRGFIDWREVGTYAGNIDQVAESLAELLQPDSAAMLIGLAEHAIEKIENAMEQVDDSNGEIGGIVCRLGELHLKACTLAKPDPVALAERLFRFETTLPFGLCSFDAATYRTPLGKKGLQRYRELAETEWQKIKPRADDKGYDAHRSVITRIMERLAEASGDVDELVAIKAKDLSSSYRYLGVAEILAKAKRHDEALDWAERGLKAFSDRPHDGLRDFLVVAYLKRKRNDEALQLTWIQFEERPGLEPYKKLHEVAGKLGIWPAQRERALAWLDQTITKEATSTSRWKPKPSTPNYSLRLSIALWEKDLDAAWTAAHRGSCDRSLLITLAGKLEKDRADDAISLYRQVIPAIVDETKNSSYEEGVRLVRRVGDLMKAQKKLSQYGDYLAELRLQFKPKRNFIKLLDDVVRSMTLAK
ncbi:MAG: SWIM zinc finger family protein [Betaproteobacteria bacterium]|nr:SWIM zinc finger family protein [Betaproteobacteria bacterium]